MANRLHCGASCSLLFLTAQCELFCPIRSQVYIWVLNDDEDFQRAFDLGATGVMTDFPTKLKDFIERNGITKP